MASMLIHPDRSIAQPRRTRLARYELIFDADQHVDVGDPVSKPGRSRPKPVSH